MNTKQAILTRQSCRSFTEEQVSEEMCKALVEAANAAPVANGVYADVRLTVIQSKEVLSQIEAVAAKAMPGLGEHPMYGAPTVILVSGKKGDATATALGYCNASCIIENILLDATELGLGSVYLFAVPAVMQAVPELSKAVGVPEDYMPLAMAAVGKPVVALQERPAVMDRIQIDML